MKDLLLIPLGLGTIYFTFLLGNENLARHNCWMINYDVLCEKTKNQKLIEWQNREMRKQNEYMEKPFYNRIFTSPPAYSKYIETYSEQQK